MHYTAVELNSIRLLYLVMHKIRFVINDALTEVDKDNG